MKNLILILGLVMLFPPVASWAQIAPPNAAGVSMGQLHFTVKDVEGYKKFFTTLGAVPKKGNALEFPGAWIFLQKGDPSGGMVGSAINHFGLQVPDTDALVATLKAAGYKTEIGANPGQYFAYGPDELTKIELLPNKALTMPVVFHHIHFFIGPGPDGGDGVKEIQAWYAKVFSAIPGRRAIFDAADLPGVNLTFSKNDTATAPTAGRVLDYIGFEVTDVEGFCKTQTAAGIKFDSPCTKKSVWLTDPFGTKIELTNNLSKM